MVQMYGESAQKKENNKEKNQPNRIYMIMKERQAPNVIVTFFFFGKFASIIRFITITARTTQQWQQAVEKTKKDKTQWKKKT